MKPSQIDQISVVWCLSIISSLVFGGALVFAYRRGRKLYYDRKESASPNLPQHNPMYLQAQKQLRHSLRYLSDDSSVPSAIFLCQGELSRFGDSYPTSANSAASSRAFLTLVDSNLHPSTSDFGMHTFPQLKDSRGSSIFERFLDTTWAKALLRSPIPPKHSIEHHEHPQSASKRPLKNFKRFSQTSIRSCHFSVMPRNLTKWIGRPPSFPSPNWQFRQSEWTMHAPFGSLTRRDWAFSFSQWHQVDRDWSWHVPRPSGSSVKSHWPPDVLDLPRGDAVRQDSMLDWRRPIAEIAWPKDALKVAKEKILNLPLPLFKTVSTRKSVRITDCKGGLELIEALSTGPDGGHLSISWEPPGVPSLLTEVNSPRLPQLDPSSKLSLEFDIDDEAHRYLQPPRRTTSRQASERPRSHCSPAASQLYTAGSLVLTPPHWPHQLFELKSSPCTPTSLEVDTGIDESESEHLFARRNNSVEGRKKTESHYVDSCTVEELFECSLGLVNAKQVELSNTSHLENSPVVCLKASSNGLGTASDAKSCKSAQWVQATPHASTPIRGFRDEISSSSSDQSRAVLASIEEPNTIASLPGTPIDKLQQAIQLHQSRERQLLADLSAKTSDSSDAPPPLPSKT